MKPSSRTSTPVSSPLLARRLVLRALAAVGGLALFGSRRALAGQAPEFLVIANKDNPQSSVDREFLRNVFLKKTLRWEGGEPARPVDLRPDSATRRAFSEGILKRPIAAVQHYWQQRIFSGRDLPPPELDPEEAVLRYVAKYKGAIGYVSASAKLVGVKVLTVVTE